MRIPSKITAAERAARAGRAEKKKDKKSSRTKAGASVNASVSAKARNLAQDAGIDIQKVERLRELIENGELVINYQLVAERILQG